MSELKDLIERLENDALVGLLKERNRDISFLSDQALVTAVELKTGWPSPRRMHFAPHVLDPTD